MLTPLFALSGSSIAAINLVLGLSIGFAFNMLLAARQRLWSKEDEDRRNAVEHQRWLRDRRREAYASVLAIESDVGWHVSRVTPHRVPTADLTDSLQDCVRRLSLAEGEVTLLGSREADDALTRVFTTTSDLTSAVMRSARDGVAKNMDEYPEWDPWCHAQREFRTAAQVDVAVPRSSPATTD